MMRRADPTHRRVNLFGSLVLSERCNARFAAFLEQCVAVLAEVAPVAHGWVRHTFTHQALPLDQVVLGGAYAVTAAEAKALRLGRPISSVVARLGVE